MYIYVYIRVSEKDDWCTKHYFLLPPCFSLSALPPALPSYSPSPTFSLSSLLLICNLHPPLSLHLSCPYHVFSFPTFSLSFLLLICNLHSPLSLPLSCPPMSSPALTSFLPPLETAFTYLLDILAWGIPSVPHTILFVQRIFEQNCPGISPPPHSTPIIPPLPVFNKEKKNLHFSILANFMLQP